VDTGQANFPAGPRSGAAARFQQKLIFHFSFLANSPKIPSFEQLKIILGFGVKIKIVPNFMLYNFTIRSKVKFQIVFEL
jgi:hypothetical protein